MAILPDPLELSDVLNLTSVQKGYFEDLVAVARQRISYGHDDLMVISGDSIAPVIAQVEVYPEADEADDLDTIDGSDFEDGQIVLVTVGAPYTITFKNTGNIRLLDAAASIIGYADDVFVFEMIVGGDWEMRELHRATTELKLADLGLGDVALKNTGHTNGLEADTVDLEDPTGWAVAVVGDTSQAANASLLGGLTAAVFAQKLAAAEQTFLEPIRTTGKLIKVDAAGEERGVELRDNADLVRGVYAHDGQLESDYDGFSTCRNYRATGELTGQIRMPGQGASGVAQYLLENSPGGPATEHEFYTDLNRSEQPADWELRGVDLTLQSDSSGWIVPGITQMFGIGSGYAWAPNLTTEQVEGALNVRWKSAVNAAGGWVQVREHRGRWSGGVGIFGDPEFAFAFNRSVAGSSPRLLHNIGWVYTENLGLVTITVTLEYVHFF